MLKAVLEKRKTQTRRVIKPQPNVQGACLLVTTDKDSFFEWCDIPDIERIVRKDPSSYWHRAKCPYGKPGDRLWIQELVQIINLSETYPDTADVKYLYDGEVRNVKITDSDLERLLARKDWTQPTIPRFMLKSFTRHWLMNESIRVEQLQSISEEDAKAEGSYLSRCACLPKSKDKKPIDKMFSQNWCHMHGQEFKSLWDFINAKTYPWDSNPWLWVIQFKREE